MIKLMTILFALVLAYGAKAQVKVCMSYDDYKANNWSLNDKLKHTI